MLRGQIPNLRVDTISEEIFVIQNVIPTKDHGTKGTRDSHIVFNNRGKTQIPTTCKIPQYMGMAQASEDGGSDSSIHTITR